MEEQIVNEIRANFERKGRFFVLENRELLKDKIPKHHWDENQCVWFSSNIEGITCSSPCISFDGKEGYRIEFDFTVEGILGYDVEHKEEYELYAKFDLHYTVIKYSRFVAKSNYLVSEEHFVTCSSIPTSCLMVFHDLIPREMN